MTFEFDTEAIGRVYEVLDAELAPLDIPEPFLDPVRERFYESEGGMGQESFRRYVNAYIDFYRLVEEIRFQTALAYLLLEDYDRKAARGDAPARRKSELPIPLPAESIALLLKFFREAPNPADLFTDPYSEMTGSRLLSDWFAGQVLDGVLVRQVAACDRLATMLWTRVEEPIRTNKAGREFFPTFRRETLKQLAPHYDQAASWPGLLELTGHALFAFAKDLRDDFTHARRVASALHGEQFTTFFHDDTVSVGVDGDEHLAIALALYGEIVRPAVRLTGEVLVTKTKPPPPGGEEKLGEARELFDRVMPPEE